MIIRKSLEAPNFENDIIKISTRVTDTYKYDFTVDVFSFNFYISATPDEIVFRHNDEFYLVIKDIPDNEPDSWLSFKAGNFTIKKEQFRIVVFYREKILLVIDIKIDAEDIEVFIDETFVEEKLEKGGNE
jgi:hypothetical protein